VNVKWTGAVIFVKDIKASCRFYQEVMGQKVEFDFGPNIGFVGGFSLWQREHATEVIFQRPIEAPEPHHNDSELYFETDEIEAVCKRLENEAVEIIQPLAEQPRGSLSIHFYDFDGHLVELAEPMSATVQRMLSQGMTEEAAAQKTGLPIEAVRQFAAA